MTYGKRPPLDEQKSLWEASLAQEGVTTGAGAVTGDSLIDAGLIGAGANSFLSMLAVIYPGQPRLVDSMDITAFNNVTGEVTLASAYKGVAAAIPAGVPYKIVTFRFVPAEVAALVALVTALMADVGDASGATLGSLLGILGNPATNLSTTLAGLVAAGVAISGTVNDGAPAITDFDTDLAEATDDHYNGGLLMFLDGPNLGQHHTIDDYDGGNKNVSFLANDRWTDVPVNGNSFIIIPAIGTLIRAINLVPGADVATNIFMRDVLGNKTDTALEAYTAADSVMRYIKGLLDLAARTGYFEQNPPILMNTTQTLTNVAGDKDFIASGATGAKGLISTVDAKVQKVMLVIIGLATNSYAGNNALDCTTATHNQWMMNLDGGAYSDLVNEEPDGQMLDNDWPCIGEGAKHPFIFEFDVTAQVANIDGKIGVRLENGRAEQDGLIVTCDIFLKVLYKL